MSVALRTPGVCPLIGFTSAVCLYVIQVGSRANYMTFLLCIYCGSVDPLVLLQSLNEMRDVGDESVNSLIHLLLLLLAADGNHWPWPKNRSAPES